MSANAALCPLCGAANECAMSLPPERRPERCWCVDRSFPTSLLARAPKERCICARCLDAAGSPASPQASKNSER